MYLDLSGIGASILPMPFSTALVLSTLAARFPSIEPCCPDCGDEDWHEPPGVRGVSPRILWGPKIPKPAKVRNTTFFVKLYHKEHIFRS